jgi:cation transport ATPase
MSQINASSASNDVEVQTSNGDGVRHQAKVTHQSRGRTRVRLARESRDPANLARITQHLEAQEGVREVSANAQTGSVLVKYDHETQTHEGIMSIFEDVNVLVETAIPEVAEGEEEGDQLSKAIDDLNARVYRATGQKAHLGWFAIAGLTAAGVFQTAVFGLGLEFIPGPVLLIAAVELYRRRHLMKPKIDDAQAVQPA